MGITQEEICYPSYNRENTIVAVVYIPEGVPIKGVVQLVHGMAEHMGRYNSFARFLCHLGYIVCGNDHVGHGKSAGNPDQFGYFGQARPGGEVMVEDARYLHAVMLRRFGKIPYFMLGHSMGSFVARAYAASHGKTLTGLILSGTGSANKMMNQIGRLVMTADVRKNGPKNRNEKVDNLAFGAYNHRIKPQRTKFDWLSRDEQMVNAYIEDAECGFMFTTSAFLALTDLIDQVNEKPAFALVPEQLPILLFSGDADPVGAYGKGVKTVANHFRSAGVKDVEMILYPGGRHEMLNELNRQDVYQDVLSWIEQHSPG